MKPEDIAFLPKECILNFASESIDAAWNLLPENYRQDKKISMCTKCKNHDHSDKRFIPIIKNCNECIKN